MSSAVSAVRIEKLGKGPVTDAKPHGGPLKETDFVAVGSAVRADRFSVMLLLPYPKWQLMPVKHSANADGGSVPLSALPWRSKLVKLTMSLNMSGMVPVRLLLTVLMTSDVSAVNAARLGKGPVADDTCHGGPL